MPDRRRGRKGRTRPSGPAAGPAAATTFAHARVEHDPRRPGGRLLLLDEREASYVDLAHPSYLPWPYVRRIGDVVDTFRPPGSAIDAVHLGGGACALARYVAATRPRSRQEVVEIDEGLVAFARQHLGLRTSPRLRVRVGDAADLLPRRPDASVDLVVCDAFDGPDVPAALLTAPFAAEVRRVLCPRGVHVLNVVDAPPLHVARAAAAALLESFTALAVIAPRKIARGRGHGNVVLLASSGALPVAALAARAAASPDREEVLSGAQARAFAGVPAAPAPSPRPARASPSPGPT